MDVSVIDLSKEKSSSAKQKLAIDGNGIGNLNHLLYLLDCYQKNKLRQASASTKNRSAVRGGGAKPYKQKGTGKARRGTNRTPLRVGGGVIFGPQPRDINVKLNNQTIKKAIKGLLQSKEDQIVILKNLDEENAKTKYVSNCLEVKPDETLAFVLTSEDEHLERGCRNLNNVYLFSPEFLPVSQVLAADRIFFSDAAIAKVEEILGK